MRRRRSEPLTLNPALLHVAATGEYLDQVEGAKLYGAPFNVWAGLLDFPNGPTRAEFYHQHRDEIEAFAQRIGLSRSWLGVQVDNP